MSNILLTALFPHPPIIVPEVGRGEENKTSKTISALNTVCKRIVELNPDTIVIITPHSYFNPHFFSVYNDEILNGNFANFGAPQARFSFDNDKEFIDRLELNAKEVFHKLERIPPKTYLDHGSGVPLYYLKKAGYGNKIAVINYTALNKETHMRFGGFISKTAEDLGQKIVFIASGDLSHRLLPTAPAGYNPHGRVFDEIVTEGIKKGNYESIISVDAKIRENAGECGFNSLMTAFGGIGREPQNNEVLSYEGPFGVGYIVAVL